MSTESRTSRASGTSAVSTVTHRLAGGYRTLRWYVRGVVGEDAYERYVDHLRRHDPGARVPTEREFWREKYADQERNPRTRCC